MKKLISLTLALVLLLSNINILEVYGNTVENNESSYSGGSGTVSDPYRISSIENLKDIRSNLDKYFIQTQNIDISSIDDWTPIGSSNSPFNGIYDGNGYNIENLKITTGSNNAGLFGYIGSESVIKNINLINPNITSSTINFIGSLVGYSNGGTVRDCSSINGSVTGGYAIGGLVGVAKSSLISNSYFTGEVESENVSKGKIGGLVGYTNIISENHRSNIIQECYTDAIIDGGYNTGGLVGDNTGTVRNSFSSGSIIHGTTNTGGLIGQFNIDNLKEYKIENCFSINSFDIDNVTTSFFSNGLIGNEVDEIYIESSFWDEDFKNSDTINLQSKHPYIDAGWDFNNIWTIDSFTNDGYPFLINLPKHKLKISGDFSVEDKEHDGTAEVVLSSENLTLSGIFIDEDINNVKLNPVASFNDSEIGKHKTVDLYKSYLTGKYGFLNELDFKSSPTASADIYGYADYTNTYYIESLTEGKYHIHSTSTKSGLIGENTTISSITIDGFTENTQHIDRVQENTILADDSLELKLYYDRDLYTVTFMDYDNRIIDTQEVKYESNGVLPENPYRSGYKFIGWSGSHENITQNTTIVTKYIKRKSKSSVKNTIGEENKDELLKIDVPSVDGHWSEEAVEELVSKKIIINYDTFQPEENITRVEFADYITRALGLYKENNPYKISFTDISNEHLLSDSLKSALEHGIIKGYEDKTFRPEQTISRQEAMVMYARAMKILGVNFLDLKSLENYSDYSQIGDWAFNDVRTVVSAEVFRGTSEETLSPLSTFKHSEAAESIRNLLYIESTH